MPLTLKSCPRCKGDLFIDRDQYGPFLQCLQCGYLRDLRVQTESEEEMPVEEKEPILVSGHNNGKV